MDEPKIKAVSITLTQSCNLACVYCYEQHKSSQIIPVDTAKRIIDKELAGCDNYDHIELDFFGGEPFPGHLRRREILAAISDAGPALHHPKTKQGCVI